MAVHRSLALAEDLRIAVDEDIQTLSLHDLIELDLHTARIASVIRGRVNTHAAVNKLPDELLALIFEYALPWRNNGLHSRGYWKASHRSDMLARIPLTHVCRRWRTAAVGTATLWSIIDEDLNHLQDVFLDRSGDATIQALVRYTIDRPTGTHIARHAERLNDLFVIYPPANEESGLRTELPFSVPNLECLTMYSSGTVGRDRINLETLGTIFPHGTPSLRRLVLWHLRRLPDVRYEQLTHLFISHGKRLPIIDLLRRCSALQNLALIDASVSGLPPSENENNDIQVELPNLRVLTLGTYKNPVAAVNLPKFLPVVILPCGLTLRLVGSQATTLLALNDYDLHQMPIMSTLTAMTVDLRADGHCTLRASGPSASVLLDLPDFRMQRKYGLGEPCFVPLSAVEVVTYRTELRNKDLDMLLNCSLPSLRVVRFVDAYVAPRNPQEQLRYIDYDLQGGAGCDDYIEALSWVAEASPRLVEMEIWSSNVELPGKLDLPVHTDVPIRKVTFHYTGKDDAILEEVDLTRLRNRVPEVVLCTSPSEPEPSTTMSENEALQWEDSGEWS
ncbi:hypothetical protein K466DRAFT_658672 [Polyporus arcularius HHB13444]|uniref:Uncharacterized protein n=1 Tax=Polyporus arcularius HHB13444 TaxID=1314778 RepID=A0A5C3PWV7_9APHY|nr:hypothetical protein K466DRAFT_658672 [Polyporus arcularius HHB13444]